MKKLISALPLFVAGLCIVGVSQAGSDVDKQKSIERGAAHYRIFCINCHGEKADGHGPLTGLLKIQPSDLTTLRQTTKTGESISERVFNAVNGRHEVGEGEEKKMPTFNESLEINTVMEIADFVEAIQK